MLNRFLNLFKRRKRHYMNDVSNEHPNFGPYEKWDSVSAFSKISEKSYSVFDKQIKENWSKISRPTHHLFLRIAYQAKTTSLAIRLNNSWALNIPAIALYPYQT